MTTGIDVSKVKRTPVRLAITPTNLGTAFPYGGTALGAARAVGFVVESPVYPIANEERGGLAEVVKGPVQCRLACILRQWSDSVVSTLFAEAFTGSSSGTKGVLVPGSNSYSRPGSLLSNRAVKLIVSAYDSAVPSILIYKAVPVLVRETTIGRGPFAERAYEAVFHGMLDSSNRLYAEALLADMTL